MNKIFRFGYDLKSSSGVYQKEDISHVIFPVGTTFYVSNRAVGKVREHIFDASSHLFTTIIEQKDGDYEPRIDLELFGWKRI